MSKGKPLGICRTCGSEITELSNDGVFDAGECEFCEHTRYTLQPELLKEGQALYDAIQHYLIGVPNTELPTHLTDAFDRWEEVANRAYGNAA
jgi:hypothetical protein